MQMFNKLVEGLRRTLAFWHVDHVLADSDSILRKRCGGYGPECKAFEKYGRQINNLRRSYYRDPEGYKPQFKNALFLFSSDITRELDTLPVNEKAREYRERLLILREALIKLRSRL